MTMDKFRVEQASDGLFYAMPRIFPLPGYKREQDAFFQAEALNAAFRMGQDDIKSQLRDLIGVPSTILVGGQI